MEDKTENGEKMIFILKLLFGPGKPSIIYLTNSKLRSELADTTLLACAWSIIRLDSSFVSSIDLVFVFFVFLKSQAKPGQYGNETNFKVKSLI